MMRFFYPGACVLLTLSLWLGKGQLQAQVDVEDLPPVSRTYALTNVTIHSQPGQTIEGGTVVIKNGLISAAGRGVSIPGEAIRVDVDSMHVYAGFIDGMSHAGVEEDDEERDRSERTDDPSNPPMDLAGIQPQRMALDLIDPSSSDIEKLRRTGFTVSHVVPEEGMLPGQGALVLLAGQRPSDMQLASSASMLMQFDGAGRVYPANLLGVSATFKQMMRQAQYAIDHMENYTENPAGMARPAYDQEVMALVPVVKGELPAFFVAPGRKDIHRAMTLQRELGGFPLVLGGLEEGAYVLEDLKAADIPIFLTLELPDEPEKMEEDSTLSEQEMAERQALFERRQKAYDMALMQASKLQEAGVEFGFVSAGTSEKDIPDHLRRLVAKGGLSEDAALAALTTHPAKMLGLANRLGTIEVGKIANLVVSDGAYFSEDGNVSYVFVDGQPFEVERKKKRNGAGGKPADILGTWAYTIESPQGESGGDIRFQGEPDAYEGTITSDQVDRSSQLDNVDVYGSNLTFSYDFSLGGNEVTIEVDVEIEGETFEGTVTVGSFGSFPIEGERTDKPE